MTYFSMVFNAKMSHDFPDDPIDSMVLLVSFMGQPFLKRTTEIERKP